MEALVAIIDRLIALLQGRKESRVGLFRDHIEPVFLDLSTVHADCVAAFGRIRQLFWDSRVQIWEIAPKVDEMRRQLDHVRTKINALTAALKAASESDDRIPTEALKFADAVADYFKVGAGHGSTLHPTPGPTFYTTLLDLITLAETQSLSRKECEWWAESLFESVRGRWSDVTVAYAIAKMACLR